MQHFLGSLQRLMRPMARRPSRSLGDVRFTLTQPVHSDPAVAVPTLDLSFAAQSSDEDEPTLTSQRPSLRRQNASRDVVPRVRARRNAIAYGPGGLEDVEPTGGAPTRMNSEVESLTEESSVLSDSVRQLSRKLSARSAGVLDQTCAICASEIIAHEEVAFMPCEGLHPFHQACIGRWLGVKPQCPTCRWTDDETTVESLRLGFARAEAKFASLRRSD